MIAWGWCRWGFVHGSLHEEPCTGFCMPGCIEDCKQGCTVGVACPVAWWEFALTFCMSHRIGTADKFCVWDFARLAARDRRLHLGCCMDDCAGGAACPVAHRFALPGVIPSPGGSEGRQDMEAGTFPASLFLADLFWCILQMCGRGRRAHRKAGQRLAECSS